MMHKKLSYNGIGRTIDPMRFVSVRHHLGCPDACATTILIHSVPPQMDNHAA